MKITQEHQDKLESLLELNAPNGLKNHVAKFNEQARLGFIKVKGRKYVRCFWELTSGEALWFVCDEIYKYADDEHLATFYKKLYNKYS